MSSRLAGLFLHLLKWQSQPERRGRSWQASIAFQRHGIARLLKDNPSLGQFLSDPDFVSSSYRAGQLGAIAETGLEMPETPAFSLAQALDADFLSDDRSGRTP